MRFITWFLLLCLAFLARAQSIPAVLTSPGAGLSIEFLTTVSNKPAGGGKLVYSVVFHGMPLVVESGLRLDLEGQPPLGTSVRIAEVHSAETDETYRLVTGKASVVRNHYKSIRIDLEEMREPRRKLAMEARAYDDAVAFRYIVPDQPGLREFRLAREATEFRIVKDATAYALILPHFRSMYESEFVKMPVTALANQGGVASTNLLGLPLLMDVPGVAWMAITEADLRDYSSMYLVNDGGGWGSHRFESRIAPQVGGASLCVTGGLPHHSPWRVIMAGSEPGRLIESTVLMSLNPESAIADTSWIHAGKATWDWWNGSVGADGKGAYTTANMKHYVDFAAKSGFEYMLVDAGWATWDITKMNGRVDIPELVRYANPKGVKIWIWLGYREANEQMDQAFPLYEKWGVAGMKIDFIERDDQAGIDFYYRAAAKAAQHHLMLDFHGCTKPSGLDRTYPNIMGYEAVLGMEQSKGGARDNPEHHVMLPFTRMLAGRMDYTPGAFDNATRAAFQPRGDKPMVMGTRAQQLAMYVVYEAPFQMVSDYPEAYEGQPGFDFIKHAPATWDETRVLNGEPGEFVTIARRHGSEWFLGSMTDWKPRDFEIPLDFLGKGRFTAEIYGDAPDADAQPKHLLIETKRVASRSHLKLRLAPGGGCAVRFVAGDSR